MNHISKTFFSTFLSLTFFSSVAIAQKTPAPTPAAPAKNADARTEAIGIQKTIYQNALKYGDANTAKTALHTLIALNATDASYKDSLLTAYFSSQASVSAVLLGRELNTADPNNKTTLAILAASEQSVGLITESLDHYKKLYALSKSPADLYQGATLEFRLQRVAECKASLDAILANPASEKEEVYISYSEREGQNVPLKAACWNIMGFLAQTQNNKEAAKECFNKALQIFPEFALVKNNLEYLENPPKEQVPQGQNGQVKLPNK